MTLDGLPLVLANGVGVVGVVVIVGWLVWTGRLMPKATHDQQITLMTRQLDDERHEKDEWRAESRIKDAQIQELSDQNDAMLRAFGPTLTEFLQGLRRAGLAEAGERAKDGDRS